MVKRKQILRFLMLCFFGGVFVLLLVIGYSLWLVDTHNVDQTFYRKSQIEEFQNSEKSTILSFEKDGTSLVQDLKFLFPFTEIGQRVGFQKWLLSLDQKRVLLRRYLSNGKLAVEWLENHQLKLASLNSCERVYCFQHTLMFEQIPAALWKGLIGLEDIRFTDHAGIDFKAIARAIVADIKALGFVQGGSTLTQQMARNIFLNHQKSLKRKINEIILSVYIEYFYSKEEILQTYFNEIVWGSLSGVRIKGVSAASLVYFRKGLQQLSDFEMAILIGMLKGPFYYHPLSSQKRLKARAEVVFRKLQELGIFSTYDNSEWSEKQWSTWIRSLESWNQQVSLKSYSHSFKLPNDGSSDYFKAWWSGHGAQDQFYFMLSSLETLKWVESLPDRRIEEFELGVRVLVRPLALSEESSEFITGDRDQEETADEDERQEIDQLEADSENQSQPRGFYSKLERNLEGALADERYQIGSILKPLVYQVLMNSGKWQWDDLLPTSEVEFDLPSGAWSPGESSEIKSDKISVAESLQRSRNRPLLRMAKEYGFQTLELELLEQLPRLQTPLGEFPAQLLGTLDLSMTEVSEALSLFIQKECQSKLFSLNDNDKNDNDKEEESGLGQNQGGVLDKLLDPRITTLKGHLFNEIEDVQFFGKTGTSNNSMDNWFVGTDGRNLVVIWLGVDGPRQDRDIRLAGSSTSFRIFQDTMIRRGRPFKNFSCVQ